MARDAKGRWLPGEAPKGAGRPKGCVNKPRPLAPDIAALIDRRIGELAGMAVDVLERRLAENDLLAARTILERTHPAPRHPGSRITVPEVADGTLTLEEKIIALGKYLADGRVTVEQFLSLSRALEAQARLVDLSDVQNILSLVRSGTPVMKAIETIDQRSLPVKERPNA